MSSKIEVTFSTDKNTVLISVVNEETKCRDQFEVNVSEQGSSYHLLLSKVGESQNTGLYSVREQIDQIGENEEEEQSEHDKEVDYALDYAPYDS